MHGFFMPLHIYKKLRAITNPFEYEEYQQKQIEEKLQKKRESRILSNVVKVNKKLAERVGGKSKVKGGKVDLFILMIGGRITKG